MIDEANRGKGSTMGRNDISGFSARVPQVGESATDSTSKPKPKPTGQRDTGERTVMPAALARLGTRPVPDSSPGPADPATQRRSFSTKPKASGVADSHDAAAAGFAARRSPALIGQAVAVEHVRTAPAPVTMRQAFPVTDPDGPPMTVALRDYPGKPGVHLVVNPDGGPARFTATPRGDGKLLIAPLMKAAAYDEHGEHVPGTDPRDLSIRWSGTHSDSTPDEADPRFSAERAEAYGSPSEYLVTQRDKDISACERFEFENRAVCAAAGIDKVGYREFDAFYDTHDVKSIEDVDDVGDAEFVCVTIETGEEALLTEGVATCHSITLYGETETGEMVMMSYHDGGDDNVLTKMAGHMRDAQKMGGMPAQPRHFMIVGGQFSPGGGDDANTITRERELLAESLRLNIPVRAARLHTTTLALDEHGNELENQRARSVAVMSTATGIFYRDEDGSSEAGSPARSDG